MLKDTFLFREIHEQPEVLARFLKQERPNINRLAAAITSHKISHVVIAARGTSDNASRYAKYVLGAVNGFPVALAAPSLFSIYQRPPRFGRALVLGISQSGKSPDIIAVLTEAKRQGALTAVITNDPTSELAQTGEIVIDLHAGAERAVAATKTYTAELAAIALLSATLAGDKALIADLEQVPAAVAATLGMDDGIAHIAPRYRYMEHCVIIGRGFNYATAFELALKLKELSYTVVESYSSADFLHGPMAVIEPGFPIVLLAPSGVMLAELRQFTMLLEQRQAEVITISDDSNLLGRARIPLQLPHSVPEWVSPITAIIPGQLLALHLAHIRDYDVDSPRGLHKITETR